MRMKKVIAGLLAAAMLLALSACGNSQKPTNSGGTPGDTLEVKIWDGADDHEGAGESGKDRENGCKEHGEERYEGGKTGAGGFLYFNIMFRICNILRNI